MAFKKGQSGNLSGRPKSKVWSQAIKDAVEEILADGDGNKLPKLRHLARKLVEKGLEGDTTALKEIGDRLEGKVPQAVTGDPDGDAPFLIKVMRYSDGPEPAVEAIAGAVLNAALDDESEQGPDPRKVN